MKRLLVVILLFGALIPLFPQNLNQLEIENEYYGLKWGCSPTELKTKYPLAYANGTNKNGDVLYYLDTNDATRIFFFGNNKLYIGRIAYADCSDEKLLALMKKITDTYGKFDDSSKGSQSGNEYVTFIKQLSPKVRIEFQVTSVKNSYGRTVSQEVFITYIHNELSAAIARERINKMQDDLEL